MTKIPVRMVCQECGWTFQTFVWHESTLARNQLNENKEPQCAACESPNVKWERIAQN